MKYLIAVLLLLPTFAFATNNHRVGDCNSAHSCNRIEDNSVSARSHSDADAYSRSSSNATGVATGLGIGGHQSQGIYSSEKITVEGDELDIGYESDNDVSLAVNGDTTTYTYREPPIAMAGFAQNIVQGCDRILGFDFRGASDSSAGGASFGVPLPNGECRLDKATAQAFALGNYEMGWKLFCGQRAVWKGYRTVAIAEGLALTKNTAIVHCVKTGQIVEAPPKTADELRREFDEKLKRMFQTTQTK